MSSLEEKVETLKLADIENKEPNLAKDADSVEDSLVACDDTGDNTLNKVRQLELRPRKRTRKKGGGSILCNRYCCTDYC